MFLYFSDWTTPQNLAKLDERGFPHAGKLIKVNASLKDPSQELGRKITVVEESSKPFEPNERFKWFHRGPWSGTEMEVYLHNFHLPEEAKQQARALFRFADSPEMGIVELAMLQRDSAHHFGHPLAIIHGLEKARDRQDYNCLHLDIFSPPSIDRLGKIIDLENAEGLLTIRESAELTRTTPEGSPPTKESH